MFSAGSALCYGSEKVGSALRYGSKLVALSAMVQRKLVFSAGGPAEGHWDECLFVAYVWLCSARASLQ